MARKRKRKGSGKPKGERSQKRRTKKSLHEEMTEEFMDFDLEPTEEWEEEHQPLLDEVAPEAPMTVGDIRRIIEEERYDLLNPYEEVGECSLCGRPIRYIDIANSDYPDDTPIEEATDIVCRICSGEVSDWEDYFEEGY
ncbi:MAG: hypothetical protein HZRFUVUK_001699 [Candidatus Fervidibacterota bacterium]|jgi:hypothetical protein